MTRYPVKCAVWEEESEGRFGGRFASVALAKEGEAAENQLLRQQAKTACPEGTLPTPHSS
jgi:hypothetical protein